MKTFLAPLAAVVLAAGASAPALAHHSVNGQYDVSKFVTVTAVLVEFREINPHTRWGIVVKDPKAGDVRWELEGVSPNVLRRQGVKIKEDIKIGETYTFQFSPPWNGAKTGLLTAMDIKGKHYIYNKL